TLPPPQGAKSNPAYLEFELEVGGVQRPLVETLAHLHGRSRETFYDAHGKVSTREKALGPIPLKNDQSLWTFGREHNSDDLHIAISPEFGQVSRRQGYFHTDAAGDFFYTDLGSYGVKVDGRSVPTQVPIPLR